MRHKRSIPNRGLRVADQIQRDLAELIRELKDPRLGMVTAGVARRGARVRILRDNVVVFSGEVDSVKRMKDDVREVKEGFECGIKLKNYQDIAEGDQIEVFEVKEVARTL